MRLARLDEYLELTVSNEDVKRPKPDPEMYQVAFTRLGVSPTEVVVVEDNDHGVAAARASGAHVMVVGSPEDVRYSQICKFIHEAQSQ